LLLKPFFLSFSLSFFFHFSDQSNNLDIICVVRKEEQAEICRKEGAGFFFQLIISETSDLKLKEICT